MKAVCRTPVEIYDEGLRGVYAPGQVIEGPRAKLLVERYPQHFEAQRAPKESKE